jgi:hypothetical protein
MMSSMAWVWLVVSPAPPHSVSSMASYYCVVVHYSGACLTELPAHIC